MDKENMPLKTFRAGLVRAVVWKNKAEAKDGRPERTFHSVVLERRYKGEDGEWHSTNRFDADRDVPKAVVCLQKAFEFVAMREKEQNGDNAGLAIETVM